MQATSRRATSRVNTSVSGFTLVELLVVIAVIAILIGVLLPALAGAREAGYKSVSAGNLRSIATLMNVYGNDYDSEFPMVTGNPRTASAPPEYNVGKDKRLPPSVWAQVQGTYGGFAGFFSYDQEDKNPSATAYTVDKAYYHNGSNWTLGSKEGRAVPICFPYVESGGDFGMLQNPADRLDGGENGLPAIRPETIKDEKGVCWHNISYMYVAGLNQRTPQLGILGDETNALDWGNTLYCSTIGANTSNWRGTLRKNEPDLNKRGYNDRDNHGKAGGNFAYTDAHVEWIPQRFGVKQTNTYQVGFDPHDRIFAEIQRFLAGGTGSVQTID